MASSWDWSVVATVGVAVLSALNGWMIVIIRRGDDRYAVLHKANHDLRDKIHEMNLLVQGQYLTRNEFREGMKEQTHLLETLFSRLESKIDRKVDK